MISTANHDLLDHHGEEPTGHPTLRTRDVGIIDPHYNLENVSYGLDVPGYRYRKVKRVPIQRFERNGTFLNYTPLLLDRGIDLMHTFNMMPLNSKRFVLSCEMELPRYLGLVRPWQVRVGHRLLASSACRSILMLSDIARSQARQKFTDLGLPEIAEKIQTFRGGVSPSVSPAPRAPVSRGPLRALFVGRDAVRKGLVPTLDAIEALRKGGLEIELTVVSSLDAKDDYVFGDSAPDLDLVRSRVMATPWVRSVGSAPNTEVRAMMRDHDVFILPTMDESLGWVVIEAATEGCPVITTDIFAIPELVDDGQTGFLLNVPCNQERRWEGLFLSGRSKREATQSVIESLTNQIMDSLQQACRDREGLAAMGNSGRLKMESMYGRPEAAKRLQGIYEHALR